MENLLDKDSYIKIFKKENEELKNQNQELQERLSKYTNPERVKKYQERNKEIYLRKRKNGIIRKSYKKITKRVNNNYLFILN